MRKMERLRRLLQRNLIVCVQESHGTETEIRAALVEFAHDFFIYISVMPDRNTRGVVIICSKRLVKSEPHVQVFDIIPGRLHAICISHMVHDVCLTIVNVHNHELSLADLSRFEVWFAPRVRASQDNPTRKQVWPTGDMNFAAAGDLPRRVDCTGQTVDRAPIDTQQHMTNAIEADPRRSSARYHARRLEEAWRHTLSGMADISSGAVTHFAANANTVSRIDRIFRASPAWLLDKLHLQSRENDDPFAAHLAKLSDHVPVDVKVSVRRVATKAKRPVPNLGSLGPLVSWFPERFGVQGAVGWLISWMPAGGAQALVT